MITFFVVVIAVGWWLTWVAIDQLNGVSRIRSVNIYPGFGILTFMVGCVGLLCAALFR